jgi:hypothetical protein
MNSWLEGIFLSGDYTMVILAPKSPLAGPLFILRLNHLELILALILAHVNSTLCNLTFD